MVGYMRKGIAAYHESQPGDPSKLAALAVKLGHTVNPPLHLPIGTDSINNYNIYKDRLANDVNAWLKDSLTTDYNSN